MMARRRWACRATLERAGANVLILWHRLFEQGYGSQRWLT
jgi:antirestriction protein ArdC